VGWNRSGSEDLDEFSALARLRLVGPHLNDHRSRLCETMDTLRRLAENSGGKPLIVMIDGVEE
jgi:hypothetical protein